MTRWRTRGALVLTTLALTGCGGDGDRAASPPEVLFDGTPGELLPHAIGRIQHFRVRAESGDDTIASVVTTRVLSEGPDGEFIVESVPDGGTPVRRRVRETPREIRVEAVGVPGPDGFAWREIRPPAILVQTPVVALEAHETRFTRTIEVLLDSDGVQRGRLLSFEGESVRTPLRREIVVVDRQALEAIAFEIRGESDPVRIVGGPGGAAELRLEIDGTEWVAPGVGVVRESLELRVHAGARESRLVLETERLRDH